MFHGVNWAGVHLHFGGCGLGWGLKRGNGFHVLCHLRFYPSPPFSAESILVGLVNTPWTRICALKKKKLIRLWALISTLGLYTVTARTCYIFHICFPYVIQTNGLWFHMTFIWCATIIYFLYLPTNLIVAPILWTHKCVLITVDNSGTVVLDLICYNTVSYSNLYFLQSFTL